MESKTQAAPAVTTEESPLDAVMQETQARGVSIYNAEGSPFENIEKVGDWLHKCGMVEKRETGCIVALTCAQEDITITEFFDRYHVAFGKPSRKAEYIYAHWLQAGGTVEWVVTDEKMAEAIFKHPRLAAKGFNPGRVTFESCKKSMPSMWKNHPRQMLRWAVIREGLSALMPGKVSGMAATVGGHALPLDAPPGAKAEDMAGVDPDTGEVAGAQASGEQLEQLLAWLQHPDLSEGMATSLHEVHDEGALDRVTAALARLEKRFPEGVQDAPGGEE